MKTTIDRRTFLGGSAATAACLAAGHRARGANERIAIALIGCGGRGIFVARGMIENGARLACLCDLHPARLQRAGRFLADAQEEKPAMVTEMKKVFDDKDIDAVIIATPDHWHAPATVAACRAGKDVYVEKPHSHCIWESVKMMEAGKKYKRIVQVGTQNRSAPYVREAREYVRGGKLGKISLVRVYNMKPGSPFRLGDPGTCPEGFDWDTWVGRAPARPYHERIFRHGWLYLWDFSGGDMAGDGIHQLDIALMLMGDPPPPRSVRALGGRYAHRGDDGECPDVEMATWDYGDFVMTMEHTSYPRYMRKTTRTIRRNDVLPYWSHNATRIELYGTDLMMTLGRHGGGWIVQQPGGKAIETHYGRVPDQPHYKNFLECIRTRTQPNACVTIAHPGILALHMANIAHRVGNVGMRYDTETGTFDNEKANALIKDEYRKGFEIPEEV